MDIIQRAIEKKLHISGDRNLDSQTWQMFSENVDRKKLFLFGAGGGADYFYKKYKDIPLEGIIDNDVQKQGFCAEDFLGEAGDAEYGRIRISSVDRLKEYDPEKVVILITGMKGHRTIIDQLRGIGIHNYFILLSMEANERERQGDTGEKDNVQDTENYAALCCQEQIRHNKIVFFSFGTYSDHGKYITEALLRIRNDLDLVWVVNNMTATVPGGVRKVYLHNWKRYIYEMETARIWIYNMPVPGDIIKRQGQIYIQTKHWASVTLKRFYLDSATIQDIPASVANWKYNSEIIDYIITGSDFDTETCRRGFAFHKRAIQIGSPRSDAMFLQKEMKEKIYGYYAMDLSRRMLLYAPTYRYRKDTAVRSTEIRDIALDYEKVKETLEIRFGGEWYIMLRLPPGYEKEGNKIEKPAYIIDSSAYSDGEELAAACDVMISDYSSIMFEPAFVRKPVFLFATDQETYIDREYDLLIDYKTLPFPIAGSNDELIKNIEYFDRNEYEKGIDDFMDQYGVHEDGHASERAAKFISDLIDT